MTHVEHETLRRLLDLELDGELAPQQRGLVEDHLAGCASCRQEREDLLRVGRLLDSGRIAVSPSFRAQVMSALPVAGWEARHPRTWSVAIAAFLALVATSVVLLGGGSAGLEKVVPFAGALAAVVDFFGTSLLAGGGLLAASWRGVGLAVASLLSGSVANAIAFFLGVAGLNYVLYRLLRQLARRVAPAIARRSRHDGR